MAERSKAPDSRVRTLSLTGVFWSTNVGVGSNPTSDKVFFTTVNFAFLQFVKLEAFPEALKTNEYARRNLHKILC